MKNFSAPTSHWGYRSVCSACEKLAKEPNAPNWIKRYAIDFSKEVEGFPLEKECEVCLKKES